MKLLLLIVLIAVASTLRADDGELAKRLDDVPIKMAVSEFDRIVQQGTREEWDQLHAYWVGHPDRYQAILRVVDGLPWNDQNGKRIRNNDRVTQFNGSLDRFIVNMDTRDLESYVDTKLRFSKRSMESWIRSLSSRNTNVPGANGDNGRYGGDRRLAIAVIKRKFPHLDTSYDWKRYDRFSRDDRDEVQKIGDYIKSQRSLEDVGKPNDDHKSR